MTGTLPPVGFHRLAVEVGSAYGEYLALLASTRPNTFHIGIEVDGDRYNASVSRAHRINCSNVLFINKEAHGVFQRQFGDGVADEVYILFPTPYPNSLNQNPATAQYVRGRLFTPSFVRTLYRIMAPGGTLRIVTDHEAYYQSITFLLSNSHFTPTSWVDPLSSQRSTRVGTHWERKQLENGKRIYLVQCVK